MRNRVNPRLHSIHRTVAGESGLGSRNTKKILGDKILLFILILLITNQLISLVRFVVMRLIEKRFVQPKEFDELPITKGKKSDLSKIVFTQYSETPPLIMGPQRLHYQYAVVLPQTYLTLLSVLQGLVFGVLLLNIPLPSNTSLTDIPSFLLQQYLYLPFIISALMILMVWIQTVQGIMFLIWPLGLFQTALIFLISSVEVIAFLHIKSFSIWLFSISCITIIGGVFRFNNMRLLSSKERDWLPPLNKSAAISRESDIFTVKLYISLGSIFLIISLFINKIIDILKVHNPFISSFIPWFINIMILVILCIVMSYDVKSRRSFLGTITENSDLVLASHGVMSYKEDK